MLSKSLVRRVALFLGVAVLAASVAASPFDLEFDEAPTHIKRAVGGKYVGASCASNSECYSENCFNATSTHTGTCQRQPTGGPCFKNANCLSWNCYGTTSARTCQKASKIYGVCGSNGAYCKNGLECSGGICRYGLGTACTNNKQCSTMSCSNNVCATSLLAPNQQCTQDSQCASGQCVSGADVGCENPDGSYTDCPGSSSGYYGYYTSSSICARYPIGHVCKNQGECAQGLCTNGKCVAGKDGDACKIDADCPTSGFCVSGKCTTPAPASVYPKGLCGADSQCISGRCVDYVVPKDSQGVNNGINGQAAPQKRYSHDVGRTSTCDYIQDLQKGCRSLFDCALQLCKNGVCVFGSLGDQCSINYQCDSKTCNLQGKCIDPPPGAGLAAGQPSANVTQCLSGRRKDAPVEGVLRPSLQDPNVLSNERDFICSPSLVGGKCYTNSDCSKSTCINGICQRPTSSTTKTTATSTSTSTSTAQATTTTVTVTVTVTVTSTATASGAASKTATTLPSAARTTGAPAASAASVKPASGTVRPVVKTVTVTHTVHVAPTKAP